MRRRILAPGAHAFWKGVAKARILDVDLREQVVDVADQEVADPVKAMSSVEESGSTAASIPYTVVQ